MIALIAFSNGACWECNWDEIGSVAKGMIPYNNIIECNTINIIALSYLLDMLRLQVTLYIICLVSWITRSAIIVFIVIYSNVVIAISNCKLLDTL